jgi:hypothetical protein
LAEEAVEDEEEDEEEAVETDSTVAVPSIMKNMQILSAKKEELATSELTRRFESLKQQVHYYDH